MFVVDRDDLYLMPCPVLYFQHCLKIKQRTLENEKSWYYSNFVDIYPSNIDNINSLLSKKKEFPLCTRHTEKDENEDNVKYIILDRNDIQIMNNNLNMLLNEINY